MPLADDCVPGGAYSCGMSLKENNFATHLRLRADDACAPASGSAAAVRAPWRQIDTVCDHCKLTDKTRRHFSPATFGYNSGLCRMGGIRSISGAFRCMSGGSLAVAVMSDAVSLWRGRNEKAERGTRLPK